MRHVSYPVSNAPQHVSHLADPRYNSLSLPDRPGMPEMLKPTSLIMGAGLGYDVACLTDGRFSGGYVLWPP